MACWLARWTPARAVWVRALALRTAVAVQLPCVPEAFLSRFPVPVFSIGTGCFSRGFAARDVGRRPPADPDATRARKKQSSGTQGTVQFSDCGPRISE